MLILAPVAYAHSKIGGIELRGLLKVYLATCTGGATDISVLCYDATADKLQLSNNNSAFANVLTAAAASIPDAALSSNVPLENAVNTFTAFQIIDAGASGGQVTIGGVGQANQQANVTMRTGSGQTAFLLGAQFNSSNTFEITPSTAAGGSTFSTPSFTVTATVVDAAAGLKIGSSAEITDHLTNTASLDFTALAANTCEVLTITVTGALDGNTVTLGVPNALADVDGGTERTTFFGWVSASDTVSVRRCNVTGTVTAEPSAATVRADVWQH